MSQLFLLVNPSNYQIGDISTFISRMGDASTTEAASANEEKEVDEEKNRHKKKKHKKKHKHKKKVKDR